MRRKIAALVMSAGLVALVGATSQAVAESQSQDIYPGQDLAGIVNSDSATTATAFYVHDKDGDPYTYNVNTPLRLSDGDELIGDTGTFIERGPAFDPQPTVSIKGDDSVSSVIRTEDTVHLEWVEIVGGTGQYSDGSPVAGTGVGLAMGKASDASSVYAVHVTGGDAAGISNAHGTFDRVELNDTTRDPNFLGFTGAGLKAITEVEIKNSFIHDNQGNGLWCDQYCNDAASQQNGFWIHDNLVVDNGRAGIRYEKVGDVPTAGEALIEHNEVHGNATGDKDGLGGVDIRDAQDALVRDNVFGARTIAGVAYPTNGGQLAISASDSGRSDRPDLRNVVIVDNVLNGETIQGCELPDEIVVCTQDTVAPSVVSIDRDADAANPTSAAGVSWDVTFSESVTGVDASDFQLANPGGGLSGTSITGVAPITDSKDTAYRITANTGIGDGTLRLDLIDDDSIADLSTNPLGGLGAGNGNFTTGQPYAIDRTVPAVTIDSTSPATVGATGSSTITWHANENGPYSVRVGGTDCLTGTQVAFGNYATGDNVQTSVSASVLSEGSNTVRVCVTDVAGNVGSKTMQVTRTSDTTSPKVTSTIPTANATGVSLTANATATFSEEMDGSTINGTTFQLFKKDSTKKIAAMVRYSANTDAATLDPSGSLQSGATYKAVVSTGAKDLAGNPLDQNSTSTGLQEMSWSFTVKK